MDWLLLIFLFLWLLLFFFFFPPGKNFGIFKALNFQNSRLLVGGGQLSLKNFEGEEIVQHQYEIVLTIMTSWVWIIYAWSPSDWLVTCIFYWWLVCRTRMAVGRNICFHFHPFCVFKKKPEINKNELLIQSRIIIIFN